MGLCTDLSGIAAAVAVAVDAAEGLAAAAASTDAVAPPVVAGMVVIILACSGLRRKRWSLARRPDATNIAGIVSASTKITTNSRSMCSF